MSGLPNRFVIFTVDGGHSLAVNPNHVRMVEPKSTGATLFMSGPGAHPDGITRRVNESFEDVMRALRGEEKPTAT